MKGKSNKKTWIWRHKDMRHCDAIVVAEKKNYQYQTSGWFCYTPLNKIHISPHIAPDPFQPYLIPILHHCYIVLLYAVFCAQVICDQPTYSAHIGSPEPPPLRMDARCTSSLDFTVLRCFTSNCWISRVLHFSRFKRDMISNWVTCKTQANICKADLSLGNIRSIDYIYKERQDNRVIDSNIPRSIDVAVYSPGLPLNLSWILL